MFQLGSAEGENSLTVSCGNIRYPIRLFGATKPIHWKTRSRNGAPNVTTDPREGDLAPGAQQILHIVGTYDGGPGSSFVVTFHSEQAASVSYDVELKCR